MIVTPIAVLGHIQNKLNRGYLAELDGDQCLHLENGLKLFFMPGWVNQFNLYKTTESNQLVTFKSFPCMASVLAYLNGEVAEIA